MSRGVRIPCLWGTSLPHVRAKGNLFYTIFLIILYNNSTLNNILGY